MRNAKEELKGQLTGRAKIKCALIEKFDFFGYDYENQFQKFKLKANHTEEELESFLESLDFEYFGYDSGFGSQELFGTVWLEDGTWLTRAEYDGSNRWEYRKLPKIPEELL